MFDSVWKFVFGSDKSAGELPEKYSVEKFRW